MKLTENVQRKPATQQIQAELHSKFNGHLIEKETITLNDAKNKLAEIKKDLTPLINQSSSQIRSLLKRQCDLISKNTHTLIFCTTIVKALTITIEKKRT